MKMKKPAILITGCGYKLVKHIFKYKGKPTHNPIFINGEECKMNIGTAVAFYLAKKNFEVIMVSRSREKLENIKKGLVSLGCHEELISYIESDVFNEKGINYLVEKLPKSKNLYWVQSVGIGGGSYKIPNDNIYLPFEKINPKLIELEMGIATVTHRLMLKLIHLFRKQVKNKQKAKICVITSMSGERGYHFGATHVAAKHALVGWIKGIEKELEDEGIDIYDIRPGGIDTGMYDNSFTRETVEEIGRRTKMWGGRKPIYAPPIEVAKKVYLALFGKNPKKVYKVLAPFQE